MTSVYMVALEMAWWMISAFIKLAAFLFKGLIKLIGRIYSEVKEGMEISRQERAQKEYEETL